MEMKKMNIFILLTLFLFPDASNGKIQSDEGRIIMDISGYPIVFELNEGESQTVTRSYQGKAVSRTISIIAITHYHEPNLWFSQRAEQKNYIKAEIEVDISGIRATHVQRPYESPVAINGLRVYVESTRD